MSELKYYVFEDMKRNLSFEYFSDINVALERFEEFKNIPGKKPALGVQVEHGSLDLLHGINGETVLVRDYRDLLAGGPNWSKPLKDASVDIQEAVRWLVLEKWCVRYEYQPELLPPQLQADITVLVPLNEGTVNSYCNGKVLKTTQSNGIDAIDSLYVEGNGWVAYNEFLKNPDVYISDDVLKVPMLNVVYVNEKNVVGIDGRMDIAPHDFAAMVNQINKPYSIVAYDAGNYNFQYKDKHDYIVGSYESIPQAVRGYYEIFNRKNVPLYVESKDSGKKVSIFNGMDKKLEGINYDKAKGMYGIEDSKGLDNILASAVKMAEERNRITKDVNTRNERDIGIE